MQRSQRSFSAGLRGAASMAPSRAPRGSAGLGRSVSRGASLPAWRARELEDDMHQLVCLPVQRAARVSHQYQQLGWHAHQQKAAQPQNALAQLSLVFWPKRWRKTCPACKAEHHNATRWFQMCSQRHHMPSWQALDEVVWSCHEQSVGWCSPVDTGLSAAVMRLQEDDLEHYGRSLRRRSTARRQVSRPLQNDADLPASSLRATAGSIGPRTQSLKPFQARPRSSWGPLSQLRQHLLAIAMFRPHVNYFQLPLHQACL